MLSLDSRIRLNQGEIHKHKKIMKLKKNMVEMDNTFIHLHDASLYVGLLYQIFSHKYK